MQKQGGICAVPRALGAREEMGRDLFLADPQHELPWLRGLGMTVPSWQIGMQNADCRASNAAQNHAVGSL